MSKPEKHIFTADEYLAYEETAETRSEFFNGELSAMGSASINHNRIITSLNPHLFAFNTLGLLSPVEKNKRQ